MADAGYIQDFAEPDNTYSSPFFLALNPSNGHVFFSQPDTDAIGELDPDTPRFQQWKTAAGSTPYDLLIDKNGNLWFTEWTGNNIGFLNPKTGKVVETPIPTANSHPYGITLDPKGNVWFAENRKGVAQIGKFTPTTNGNISIQEFLIDNTLRSQPHALIATPNGHIWITEGFLGNITEFDPATGTYTHYKDASPCRRPPDNCTHISGIAPDKQGNIWIDDSLNSTVGYYVPSKGIAKIQH